jgi:hypothetical protein
MVLRDNKLKGAKMKYKNVVLQNELPFDFRCPIHKPFCNLKTSDKKGCTRTFQVRKPYPGEVQQHSPTFQKMYPKRQAVERVNAFLQHLGWENPKCYSMKAVENIVGFALLGKSLKSLL